MGGIKKILKKGFHDYFSGDGFLMLKARTYKWGRRGPGGEEGRKRQKDFLKNKIL